jgi:hypothetical protein
VRLLPLLLLCWLLPLLLVCTVLPVLLLPVCVMLRVVLLPMVLLLLPVAVAVLLLVRLLLLSCCSLQRNAAQKRQQKTAVKHLPMLAVPPHHSAPARPLVGPVNMELNSKLHPLPILCSPQLLTCRIPVALLQLPQAEYRALTSC